MFVFRSVGRACQQVPHADLYGGSLQVIIAGVGDKESPLSEFIDCLPSNDCRYGGKHRYTSCCPAPLSCAVFCGALPLQAALLCVLLCPSLLQTVRLQCL